MSSKLAANTPRLSTRDLHRGVVEAAQNPLGGRDICCKHREREHRHQADHVDPTRRDFDAFYVDCDHDDRHADEPQTDADRMHDAIGDDFSAIVIPADLPRTYVG
jgi:hypothetical protein